jgi:asparagine synthase (glutamine-hydrolysing)
VCDLTGGYDSRVVVAALLGSGLSFSTVVSGAANSADVRVSRALAKLANLPHLHISPALAVSFSEAKQALSLTDGEYNIVEYANVMRVHKQLSQHFDISINGSFGELARGYWWELLFPHTGSRMKLDAQRVARGRFAAKPFDALLFPASSALDLASHLAGVIERSNAGLEQSPNTLQLDNVYLTLRMQRWQGKIASSTNQLWPCLSPFMFRSVLEVILQAQSGARQRSLLIRRMLAHFQTKLANVPLEHGYPPLPMNWKTWHRFWPLGVYYGKRLGNRLGIGNSKTDSVNLTVLPLRLQLWADREVNDLLEPSAMRLGALLDRDHLRRYITASKDHNFFWDEQWMRLLTMECALRELEKAGSKILT